jgi:Luciferase-like monooxygenase
MKTQEIEFGLDSPAYVTVDEAGQALDGDVVIRNTIEEAVFADAVGIDSFNIGEHYRPDLMDSAGHVMLAAIASRTHRIRLGTAVTVLSTQDPVRVYTEFATLDTVSNGRTTHRRSRLADRVLSAVRIRSRRLRATLRGEARLAHASAPGPTRHLVRDRQITPY